MTDTAANDAGSNGGVIRLLRSHRSIRRFIAEPIPSDLLETLIQAGQGAASSSFVQAYSVVRVTRPPARAAIARAAGNQPWIEEAPELLVFCADLCRVEAACLAQGAGALEGWSEHGLTAVVDCTLMAQGVMVAAESVGLGGVFIGGIRNDPQVLVDQLGLPRQVLPIFGMCLGWPDESPQVKPRQPVSMVLHQDRYRAPAQEAVEEYDRTMSDYYERRGNKARRSDWSATTARAVQGKRREHMLAFMQQMGFFEK